MMHLVSIEPTPSPNSMKLNLDESLPVGTRFTFTSEQAPQAPEYARKLLQIPGVKSLFHASDFIALDRTPKGDWQAILGAARAVLGEAPSAEPTSPDVSNPGQNGTDAADPAAAAAFGEVTVLLQTFRGIPLQVRVQAAGQEARIGMPERFAAGAIEAGKAAPNLIKERRLEELGVRYGELQDVLNEVVQELDASYTDERLQQLVAASYAAGGNADAAAEAEAEAADRAAALSESELAAQLRSPDWKLRYAALQRIKPSLQTLSLLASLLDDDNASIRRLAVVYIGDVREPEALPHLYRALRDRTPAVRRTAGDTLSDIGDPAAIPAMVEALRDQNKLVRWRAARFLYEVGDASAVADLRDAADDSEFEVRLQAGLALERIEGGRAAEGSVWQQMTRRND